MVFFARRVAAAPLNPRATPGSLTEAPMPTFLENTNTGLTRLSRAVNAKLFVAGAVAAGLMAVPTTLDVVGGLFHHPLSSSQELVEFLQVVLVYACLGYVQDQRGHIYVEMFFSRFSERAQQALTCALYGVTAVVFGVITWRLGVLALDKMASREVSMILSIPIYLFVLFAAFGSLMTTVSLAATSLAAWVALFRRPWRAAAFVALVALAVLIASPWWLNAVPWAYHKTMLGAGGMAVLMILLLLGMPVGFAMLSVGFVGMLLVYPFPAPALNMMGVNSYSTAANYMYSVVPMFILMGEFATHAGISSDLFQAANVWLGRRHGGLAIATVAGCAGFAAVSGDSMATAVTMSSVALPEMEKKRYDAGFACATLAAGGTLGILIPPSTGFIFYSLVTEVSIGKLFIAGLIPGVLLALLFMLMVSVYARRHPDKAPRGEKATLAEKVAALRGVTGMVLLIVVVLGGILTGMFSPTQGGAVGASGTLLYALARRRMTWDGFRSSLAATALVTAKLLIILVGVGLLGSFFAVTRVPFELANYVTGLGANRYVVFFGVVVLYIVLGCMINVIPMILLTLPAIFPTIQALGFDPVWFGVVSVILMEMGQITPPVGINVFAMSTAAPHVPMTTIFRNIVPYFCAMLTMVGILLLFPALATWLPGVLL